MKIGNVATDLVLLFIINSFVFTTVYLWQNDMIMPNKTPYIQNQNG